MKDKFFTSFRLFICTVAAGVSLLLTLPLQATIRILAQPMKCLLPSLNVHFSIFFFNNIVLEFKGGPPVNVCMCVKDKFFTSFRLFICTVAAGVSLLLTLTRV